MTLTTDSMALTPRACEKCKNTSTNFIGFAGAMPVKNDEMKTLVDDGPLVALQKVAVSTSCTSS